MNLNNELQPISKRRGMRKEGFDYRTDAAYALTICTRKRHKHLAIPDLKIIVLEEWKFLPSHYSNAFIDIIVIMPDHIHCILFLDSTYSIKIASVSDIMRSYKSAITTRWRELLREHENKNKSLENIWQKTFYDHIIRNEKDLELQRNYMRNNPIKANLTPVQNYVYNDHECPYHSCGHIPHPPK